MNWLLRCQEQVLFRFQVGFRFENVLVGRQGLAYKGYSDRALAIRRYNHVRNPKEQYCNCFSGFYVASLKSRV